MPAPATNGSGAMFDRIAGRYDLLNRWMSFGMDRGWRRKTIAALSLEPGARLLDLATGTADLALRALRKHPDIDVIGVDPSEAMLEVGRQKIERAGVADRLKLQLGDAQTLPFDDDSFDAVCIGFGIRNVPDRPRALAEMARVTRASGRIAILELSEPKRGFMAPLTRLHIRHIVPRLGALLSGSREYRYLQTSIAAFPAPEEFAEMMESAGIEMIETRRFAFGSCVLYVGQPAAAESATAEAEVAS